MYMDVAAVRNSGIAGRLPHKKVNFISGAGE